MNAEKLKKLSSEVRIGGKGTARRKKKVVHKTATTDDKRLQTTLKKLGVNTIPGIEEVNMIREDGTVLHFTNPKVQASLGANTFAVTGHPETQPITDMLPGILNQLGADGLSNLKKLAEKFPPVRMENTRPGETDNAAEEVPELVEDFDAPSKEETPTTATTEAENAS